MPFGDRFIRPKTLVLAIPEQLRSGFKEDFAKKIVDAVSGHRVAAIQFVPGYYVRVTFGTTQDRHDVLRYGVEIDGVDIPLIEAESTTSYVYVHHCLVEVSDNAVKDVLPGYGDVVSFEPVYYDGTAIVTGSRIVKMAARDEIPPKIYIYRYPCRVNRDQPLLCFICDSPEHLASDCPLRDKCRKCRQPGHFARACTASSEVPVSDPPSPSVDANVPVSNPSVNAALSSSSSSDESEMEPDVLVSGDEEFLAAAGDFNSSPRPTRSASKRPPESSDSCDPDADPASAASCKKPAVSPDDSSSPPSIPPPPPLCITPTSCLDAPLARILPLRSLVFLVPNA